MGAEHASLEGMGGDKIMSEGANHVECWAKNR
ncbi:hypothetical protein KS4_00060 [Poriferisphaera corsica]|uniref:Uncharacterized protein n=1 Tax=Poriferisphaera corsica TaxID=2528020 RepID=A0A517YP30_9BACT|nr:hypothetical protein KS4_00060 [Poriferisphaera corsica]